jgi:hypothetical protein
MDVLNERLEQVINLIPKYSWSLMDEAQKDELMAGIVLPRYMATTSDGTKLTPSVWAAILGASPGAIQKRVERLKANQKSPDQATTHAVTDNERSAMRTVKSTLARKPGAAEALVESLPLETRVEVAKALAASTMSTPVSGKRQRDSVAANAPLERAVNSFAAQLGTVSLIDRATDEINKAVAGSGLQPDALHQIEEAVDRLVAALDFAKSMAGEVTE